MPSQQSKNFVLTYYPDEANGRPGATGIDWTGREEDFAFMAWGEEVCPTSGRQHLQSFVCMKKKMALSAATRVIQKYFVGAHVEIMRGSLAQNEEYCSKEGQYTTWGVPPQQGKRTDLDEVAEKIKAGEATPEQILEDDPMAYHQYGRTLEKLHQLQLRKKVRNWMTEGIWYYGPTGSGKSRKAFEGFDPDTHYAYPYETNGWWDGYAGQETVIFDEFRGQLPLNVMLRLMDRYPMNVQQRGKEPFPLLAKKIIITSCMKPDEVYKDLASSDRLDQLYRRCEVERLGPDPVAPIFRPRSVEVDVDETLDDDLPTVRWASSTDQ